MAISLKQALRDTDGRDTDGRDLWVFGYASLIWKPEFEEAERRRAKVYGWHRAFAMWSTVNRGTPELPGLVCALLQGGMCEGVALRIAPHRKRQDLTALWEREMFSSVYQPKWLRCSTALGAVKAIAFTLPRSHPRCCDGLSDAQLQFAFANAQGRYGSTREYAEATHQSLLASGIDDALVAKTLRRANPA